MIMRLEIHLLDVTKDGLGEDPDIKFINKILSKVNVPVVYGCGLGDKSKFLELSKNTNLSGISAASIFHYDIQLDSNSPFSSYEGPDLRKGKEIDSGNIEFTKYGYGGFRNLFVNPISIGDLKISFDNGINGDMMKVGIIKYGVGNILNLDNYFKSLGYATDIIIKANIGID